jgi:hypothetical protein
MADVVGATLPRAIHWCSAHNSAWDKSLNVVISRSYTSLASRSRTSNSRFSIIVTGYSFVVATSVAGYAARTTKVVTTNSMTGIAVGLTLETLDLIGKKVIVYAKGKGKSRQLSARAGGFLFG